MYVYIVYTHSSSYRCISRAKAAKGTLQGAPGEELAPLLAPSLSEADLQEEGALAAQLRILQAGELIELLSVLRNKTLISINLNAKVMKTTIITVIHLLSGAFCGCI